MYIKTLLLLIAIFIIINSSDSFKINVLYGKITIDEEIHCKFDINNTIIESNNTEINGIYYGLIKYECGIYKGYLLSKPQCLECGLYCPQNDNIMKCKHIILPMILGIMISSISFILSFIIMNKIILPKYIYFKEKYIKYNKDKKDKKISKIADKIKDKNNIYLELNQNSNSISNSNNIDSNNIIPPVLPRSNLKPMHKRVYPSLTSLVAAAAVLNSNSTYACDRTLFLNSDGMICDSNSCQNINSYKFNIIFGNTICFNTPDKEIMQFEISDPKLVSRYYKIYYTTNFKTEINSIYNCKGAGLCTTEYCDISSKHHSFQNKSNIELFGCKTEGLGCDTWCWHQYACTWYHLWFKIDEELYPIYKVVNTMWFFKIKITYKKMIRYYMFNSVNPNTELDVSQLFKINNMPISIDSVTYVDLHFDKYLINYKNKIYEVDANNMNFPNVYKLGDIQISLNEKDYIYPTNNINCFVYGCKVKCITNEPMLTRFINSDYKKEMCNYNIIDDIQLDIYRDVYLSASITIGNVNFKNLYLEPASCDVDIIYTYGCIGCTDLPYAVIGSNNIKHLGLLNFHSNCSFTRSYILCSNDPYILNPNKKYDYCNIYIPSINKSLNFQFNYEFTGKLSKYTSLNSKDISFKEIAEGIFNNQNFIDSITYGLLTFTTISLIITIISRIIIRIITLREIKNNVKV